MRPSPFSPCFSTIVDPALRRGGLWSIADRLALEKHPLTQARPPSLRTPIPVRGTTALRRRTGCHLVAGSRACPGRQTRDVTYVSSKSDARRFFYPRLLPSAPDKEILRRRCGGFRGCGKSSRAAEHMKPGAWPERDSDLLLQCYERPATYSQLGSALGGDRLERWVRGQLDRMDRRTGRVDNHSRVAAAAPGRTHVSGSSAAPVGAERPDDPIGCGLPTRATRKTFSKGLTR